MRREAIAGWETKWKFVTGLGFLIRNVAGFENFNQTERTGVRRDPPDRKPDLTSDRRIFRFSAIDPCALARNLNARLKCDYIVIRDLFPLYVS